MSRNLRTIVRSLYRGSSWGKQVRCASDTVVATTHRPQDEVEDTDRQPGSDQLIKKSEEVGCFQCERAYQGVGCTFKNAQCEKIEDVAVLHDVLMQQTRSLSEYWRHLNVRGTAIPRACELGVVRAMVVTAPYNNYDPNQIVEYIRETLFNTKFLEELYTEICIDTPKSTQFIIHEGLAHWKPQSMLTSHLLQSGQECSLIARAKFLDEDIFSLGEFLTFGLKGLAFFYLQAVQIDDAATRLNLFNSGRFDVENFIAEGLTSISRSHKDPVDMLNLVERCGVYTRKVTNFLRELHLEAYGEPERTKVRTSPVKGRALLVSGAHMCDLEALCHAATDLDLNIYTHGEAISAHMYPNLKQFQNLVGHYGGRWQNQAKEFEKFPGPILATSSAFLEPEPSYRERFVTMNTSGTRFSPHLSPRTNVTLEILNKMATQEGGFLEDEKETFTETGFGKDLAVDIVQETAAGNIDHVFVIIGDDATTTDSSYYTEFANSVPENCLILTLGCIKYRLDIERDANGAPANIPGTNIPRLLDLGQSGEIFSSIKVAERLWAAFAALGKTDFPLTFMLSWFDHRTVAILMALMTYQFRNIYLGPRIPAFLSPNVTSYLMETYNIHPITDPRTDIARILNNKV